MATKVLMEALSPTMEEGRLVEWKKQEGDAVTVGEVLAEVETDKAVMDLQARAAGVMLKHAIAAGTTVPVGQLVGVIGASGEDVSALLGGSAQSGDSAARRLGGSSNVEPKPATAPVAQVKASTVASPPPVAESPSRDRATLGSAPARPGSEGVLQGRAAEGDRVKASPLARRIAAEKGVDLAQVQGSGPVGRVIVRDLEALPSGRVAESPSRDRATLGSAPARSGSEGVLQGRGAEPPIRRIATNGEPFSDVPLSQIRKTIAKRLAQSIGPIPTFYLTAEVDMERVAEAREALNARAEAEKGQKVSFNDIILKATALALRQHPGCNAWWQDDRIRYWNEIHVSVAVAIDDGLITPVVRHTDRKSLREIAIEVRDLAGRARERRLQPDEYTGGTFSVSNLGMFEIDQFTAVINPPETGILAVGSIAAKPVADGDRVVIRRRMRVTMSCDHRVIDGATGAAFLRTFKGMLENPLALVW